MPISSDMEDTLVSRSSTCLLRQSPKAPKRLFDEVVGHEQRHEMPSPESKKTCRKKDKTFYEIEIVEVKMEA